MHEFELRIRKVFYKTFYEKIKKASCEEIFKILKEQSRFNLSPVIGLEDTIAIKSLHRKLKKINLNNIPAFFNKYFKGA